MESRKAKVVDGYAAVQAVARATQRERPRNLVAPKQPSERAPTAPGPHSDVPACRIGRTVVPPKHEVVCYECDYAFRLAGRARTTFCPRCRTVLDLIDYTIEDECSHTLKTAGTIRLARQGVLKAGLLRARDVILEGRVEGGRVQAVGRLEILPGATFPDEAVSARDLVVAPGARVELRAPARFRDVEIGGELRAELVAEGLVRIRAGGVLRGVVRGARLAVEEGGGLEAQLRIEPPSQPS